MTTSASMIDTYVKATLDAAGLHAAEDNLFEQTNEPIQGLPNSYAFGRYRTEITQSTNMDSRYRAVMVIRVIRNWGASSNVSLTYLEAYKDMQGLGESLEDALTTGPGDAQGCQVVGWAIDQWRGKPEFLQLDIEIELYYSRTRT